jgi:hypothetical protein
MRERAQCPPFIPISTGGSTAARPRRASFEQPACVGIDRRAVVPGLSPELIALAPTGNLEAPTIVRGRAGSAAQLV